ncbi:MAG: hypothetical protein AB2L14_33045 [Candidatus Xenobiia bacterium LiM19]
MKKYFLVTQRLGFRFRTPGDLPVATSLWGNPEVTRLFTREQQAESSRFLLPSTVFLTEPRRSSNER